jgi:hypothetical protein
VAGSVAGVRAGLCVRMGQRADSLIDRDEPCLLTTVRIQNKSVGECELSASLNFKADVYGHAQSFSERDDCKHVSRR